MVSEKAGDASRLACLSVLLVSLACNSREPSGADYARYDSAGQVVVTNHSPAWGAGGGWAVGEDPDVVIGGYGAQPASELVWEVTGVVNRPDGGVAVLSRGHSTLFLFHPSGELERAVGGKGRGPGEFTSPQHLQRLGDDTLAVWDAQYGRISYFDGAGGLLGVRHIDLGKLLEALGPGIHTEWATPLPDGTFVAHMAGPTSGPPQDPETPYRTPVGYARVDRDYEVHELGWYEGMESMPVEMEGFTFPAFHLFPVRASLAAGGRPLAIYVSNGSSNEIDRFSAEGERTAIIRRTTEPIAITSDERREAQERFFDLNTGSRGGREFLTKLLGAMPRQRFHPPVGEMKVDVRAPEAPPP